MWWLISAALANPVWDLPEGEALDVWTAAWDEVVLAEGAARTEILRVQMRASGEQWSVDVHTTDRVQSLGLISRPESPGERVEVCYLAWAAGREKASISLEDLAVALPVAVAPERPVPEAPEIALDSPAVEEVAEPQPPPPPPPPPASRSNGLHVGGGGSVRGIRSLSALVWFRGYSLYGPLSLGFVADLSLEFERIHLGSGSMVDRRGFSNTVAGSAGIDRGAFGATAVAGALLTYGPFVERITPIVGGQLEAAPRSGRVAFWTRLDVAIGGREVAIDRDAALRLWRRVPPNVPFSSSAPPVRVAAGLSIRLAQP